MTHGPELAVIPPGPLSPSRGSPRSGGRGQCSEECHPRGVSEPCTLAHGSVLLPGPTSGAKTGMKVSQVYRKDKGRWRRRVVSPSRVRYDYVS